MTTTRDKLETILARLAGRKDEERVFLRIYEDAARIAADAADARQRAGLTLGPLDGVIVSIKDLFDVAGETTLAGSIALRDAPPADKDATIVRRLRQAGAVILGKTNMVEFAFSGIGLNPHYGTPGNAADPSRIPGGSSSGAGVTVAEGTSEISIGSDTGGSVRIPAALNGVVGFKPTAHRVPLDGAFPLAPSLDSIGPLARDVQDCAFADAIMAGEEPRLLNAHPLVGLRIGVPRGRLFAQTEPMVEKAFEAALKHLSGAGARIVDHGIDDLLEAMADTTVTSSIASIEASEVHADWLEAKVAEIDPRVHWWIARSGKVPAPIYIRMLRRRRTLVAAMDERLAPLDVLALPTTAISAPLIAPLEADIKLYNKTDDLILRNTTFGNQFDLTGISLPIPGTERPVGLMLVARHGHDQRLLDIAASVETMLAQGV
ncbi:amidase [Microvirga lotononidis]|uniref:Indoleacetamide hydrolase n=1 Tax=Microvirga lotononidis TaxID=864069 RepID=I4YMQ9_9HYPH|nr:amidase [Microvirga lotononidis]EIM25251.1 amidase, Asp-tRNAAsn/Glu-tRNAGln amidotransferase A subunit [Microvirga lotononidis]WQO29270.1 amidase [Microvirga lotononidis]